MKTEAQLDRTERELSVVRNAFDWVHYYCKPRSGFHFQMYGHGDTWTQFLRELDSHLSEEMRHLLP